MNDMYSVLVQRGAPAPAQADPRDIVRHWPWFRSVCRNGLVMRDTVVDVRMHHKGPIAERVVAGAYEVLEGFERVRMLRDGMRSVMLDAMEQGAFAEAALSLKYDPDPMRPAPVIASQLLDLRRSADAGSDLWSSAPVRDSVLLTVKATVKTMSIAAKSFNHAGLGGLLMIEWE